MRAFTVKASDIARCPEHRLDVSHYNEDGTCHCVAAQQPTPELTRPPKQTPALYAQDGKGYDAIVHAHYFLGNNDWLITEYDPADDIGFGWACLGGDRQNAELGYTSLAELAAISLPLRMTDATTGRTTSVPGAVRVDYDEDWEPVTLTEAIRLLDERQGRA